HEDIALDRLLDRPQQDAAINRLARRLDGPVLIERGYGLLIFVVATRLGDDLVELADTDPDRLCRVFATLGVLKPGQSREFEDQPRVAHDAAADFVRARLP